MPGCNAAQQSLAHYRQSLIFYELCGCFFLSVNSQTGVFCIFVDRSSVRMAKWRSCPDVSEGLCNFTDHHLLTSSCPHERNSPQTRDSWPPLHVFHRPASSIERDFVSDLFATDTIPILCLDTSFNSEAWPPSGRVLQGIGHLQCIKLGWNKVSRPFPHICPWMEVTNHVLYVLAFWVHEY